METIAVCSPGLRNNTICKKMIEFELCGEKIPVALLEIDALQDRNISEEEVVVKIKAFSCNYRDKSIMLHFYKNCKNKSVSGRLCYYPFGSEFVGIVIRVGNHVTSLQAGDRVIPDGTYPVRESGFQGGLPTNCASQRIQVFHQTQLTKIPDELSDEKAAAFTIAGQTVYSMIRKLQLKAGQNILVTAATSNTSLASIIALSRYNVNIYACSSSDFYLEKLKQIGIKYFFQTSSLENDEKILFPVGFDGFDAVIDPFYDIYLAHVLKYMKFGGKYITCGLYFQNELFKEKELFPMSLEQIMSASTIKNISIIGNCLGEKTDLEHAISDFVDGKFDIPIDSVWRDGDFLSFLERTFHIRKRLGKIVYVYE